MIKPQKIANCYFYNWYYRINFFGYFFFHQKWISITCRLILIKNPFFLKTWYQLPIFSFGNIIRKLIKNLSRATFQVHNPDLGLHKYCPNSLALDNKIKWFGCFVLEIGRVPPFNIRRIQKHYLYNTGVDRRMYFWWWPYVLHKWSIVCKICKQENEYF